MIMTTLTLKWLNSSAIMKPTGADISHSHPEPSGLYHFGKLGEDSVMFFESVRFFQYWQLSSVIQNR